MGKVRGKQPTRHSNHHDSPVRAKKIISRRQHSQTFSKLKSKSKSKSEIRIQNCTTNPNEKQHGKPNIPFTKQDRILLVGEGDFSFARSLTQHHRVGSVVATCFDSRNILEEKYPAVGSTINKLSREENSLTAIKPPELDSEVWEGFSPDQSDDGDRRQPVQDHTIETQDQDKANVTLLFGIDATKLSTQHKKTLRTHAPFTKIVFNFPHVGGLSTDVNRQVRSNQQLLVDFFKSARPILASPANPARPVPTNDGVSGDDADSNFPDHDQAFANQEQEYMKHGKILVTLFEGEPYTLWNIRDLARHSGLKVLESFHFPWSAYPGYQHARTIGDITSGKDRTEGGKRKGAWRGEERDARCYVLALQNDNDGRPAPGSKKQRRMEDDSD